MRIFERKRSWRDILQSKPVLIFFFILLLAFAWSVFGLTGKLWVTRENRVFAESRLSELKEKKERFLSDIDKLKTDEGVEASIRERFGLAKEGEGVIVILEDKNPPQAPETSSGGFFAWFKNLFK